MLQGALVLANTLPYMPVGVHLAVVDPGVGSHRRPLALRDGEGRLYVGPDNGLLVPAAERAGITDAHELANPSYALENVSRTFHGRDLFAPAAAHLSRGVAIGELGPPIDPEALVRLELPEPSYGDGVVHATMLYVDSFGNIALNLTRDDLERVGVAPGTRLELELSGRALLRGGRPHVRGCPRGRRDPVRGQLPEHVGRDLERQRGGDAARGRRPAAQHPGRVTRFRAGTGIRPPGALVSGATRGVGGAGLRPRRLSVCAGRIRSEAEARRPIRLPLAAARAGPGLRWCRTSDGARCESRSAGP